MEQLARSRPHSGANQRSFHSTKYSNGPDLTKFPSPRNSVKRKFKRNFRSNSNRAKGQSDCTSDSSSVTYKTGPANGLSETHSQVYHRSPNKHSTNISNVALSTHSNGFQAELAQDTSPPTSGFQEGSSPEFLDQWRCNSPETFVETAVSERGNGYKNFQTCGNKDLFDNQERSLPSSPTDLHPGQTNDNVYQFTNVQETDFPQSIDSYPINLQQTSDVVYWQDVRHFIPLVPDSNRNYWGKPHYMENGSFINPHFEHTHLMKPLPIYADFCYQLPGPLNVAWGVPYYTKGGLFVNPLGMCGWR